MLHALEDSSPEEKAEMMRAQHDPPTFPGSPSGLGCKVFGFRDETQKPQL